MAVWAQNRYIVGLLIVIILGHWSLILQGTYKSLITSDIGSKLYLDRSPTQGVMGSWYGMHDHSDQ